MKHRYLLPIILFVFGLFNFIQTVAHGADQDDVVEVFSSRLKITKERVLPRLLNGSSSFEALQFRSNGLTCELQYNSSTGVELTRDATIEVTSSTSHQSDNCLSERSMELEYHDRKGGTADRIVCSRYYVNWLSFIAVLNTFAGWGWDQTCEAPPVTIEEMLEAIKEIGLEVIDRDQ